MIKAMCISLLVLLTASGCGSEGVTFSGALETPNGTFRACVPNEGGNYSDILITFSNGSEFQTVTNFYNESDCSGSSLGQESASGTFRLMLNEIDYVYANGYTVYDLYNIQGSIMKVGDKTGANNGQNDPQLRPTQFSESIRFIRQ